MIVEVTAKLAIDKEAWAREYGVPLDQVEADIRIYYNNIDVRDHMTNVNAFGPLPEVLSATVSTGDTPLRLRYAGAAHESFYSDLARLADLMAAVQVTTKDGATFDGVLDPMDKEYYRNMDTVLTLRAPGPEGDLFTSIPLYTPEPDCECNIVDVILW